MSVQRTRPTVEPNRWRHGPQSQFFRSPAEWERHGTARLYAHQMRRVWDPHTGLGLWAILCIDGKPTVLFKRVTRRDAREEAQWQRTIWNQGSATMLVVEDGAQVRVYSALARPQQTVPEGEEDSRIIKILDHVSIRNLSIRPVR